MCRAYIVSELHPRESPEDRYYLLTHADLYDNMMLLGFLAAVTGLAGICGGERTYQTSQAVRCHGNFSAAGLGLSPDSQVILQSESAFANVTERWTKHHAPAFVIAVKPALESDVQKLVCTAAPPSFLSVARC